MALYGGNLEQLDHLTATFQRQADAVDALRGTISTVLANTTWTGPAADRFRSDWAGTYVPALNSLTTALRQGAVTVGARRNAIAQATA